MFLLQAALFATLFLSILAYVVWANVKHGDKANGHKGGHHRGSPAPTNASSGYGRSYTGGGYGYSRRSEAYNRR